MIGGFPPLPLMEDAAFVRRLSRVGTLVFPPVRALTSARRWECHGILATTVRNWWLLVTLPVAALLAAAAAGVAAFWR